MCRTRQKGPVEDLHTLKREKSLPNLSFPHSSGTVLWTGCGKLSEKRLKSLIGKRSIVVDEKMGSARLRGLSGCSADFPVSRCAGVDKMLQGLFLAIRDPS